MRATRRSLLLALLAPVLLLLPGVVQSGTPNMSARRILPSASILIEVKVKGTTRYTQGDVLAASALRIGVAASEDDFRKAAKELTDSGAFRDVAYSYSYSSAGTKLDLQLTASRSFPFALTISSGLPTINCARRRTNESLCLKASCRSPGD